MNVLNTAESITLFHSWSKRQSGRVGTGCWWLGTTHRKYLHAQHATVCPAYVFGPWPDFQYVIARHDNNSPYSLPCFCTLPYAVCSSNAGHIHQVGRFVTRPVDHISRVTAVIIVKIEPGGWITHVGTRGHTGVPVVRVQHVVNFGRYAQLLKESSTRDAHEP